MAGFRIAVLAACLCLTGAAAPAKIIPWNDWGEALVIPAGSPLQFVGFDEGRVARFRGEFVVTGTFVYGCDIECELPLTADQLNGSIIPDRAGAAQLPHWKIQQNDMRIFLEGGDRLAALVLSPKERRAIANGRLDSARKRVTIVIKDFNASLECDSASFGAEFVKLAKPTRERSVAKLDGNYGCGWS